MRGTKEILFWAGATVLSGAALIYAGWEIRNRGFYLTISFTPSSQGNVESSLLPSFQSSPEIMATRSAMIGRFIDSKRSLETVFSSRFSLSETRLSDSKPAVDFVHQQSRQLLVDGVALARLFLPPAESQAIDRSDNSVLIDGQIFSTDNLFDRSLAASLLALKLEEADLINKTNERRAEFEEHARESGITAERLMAGLPDRYSPRLAEIKPKIEAIRWLKDRNLPVTVDEDAFGFLPENHLASLARVAQVLDEHSLPIPKQFKFIRHHQGDPGGAWYHDHNNHTQPFTVVVTNNSNEKGEPHETGHFLSDAKFLPDAAVASKMEKFSQMAFEDAIRPAAEASDANLVEEYAEGFRKYLFEGEEERGRIGGVGGHFTQSVYQFFQRMFGGTHFAGEAQPIIKPNVRTYEAGSRVKIFDLDTDTPGFLLRPTAETTDGELRPNLPSVFHGDVVELLQNGEGRGKEMWLVKVVKRDIDTFFKLGKTGDNVVGWVDLRAFGDILSLP